MTRTVTGRGPAVTRGNYYSHTAPVHRAPLAMSSSIPNPACGPLDVPYALYLMHCTSCTDAPASLHNQVRALVCVCVHTQHCVHRKGMGHVLRVYSSHQTTLSSPEGAPGVGKDRHSKIPACHAAFCRTARATPHMAGGSSSGETGRDISASSPSAVSKVWVCRENC